VTCRNEHVLVDILCVDECKLCVYLKGVSYGTLFCADEGTKPTRAFFFLYL